MNKQPLVHPNNRILLNNKKNKLISLKCLFLSEMSVKGYILYYCNYIIFWKRKNSTGGERSMTARIWGRGDSSIDETQRICLGH